jgi:hypothetical protein
MSLLMTLISCTDLQALNGVERPHCLAARPDVVLEFFANEFVDLSLSFHMEK